MNRRELMTAAALLPLVMAGRLYAAPTNSTRFLVIFMRGAYDAANIVIPVSSGFYYQARPNIAVARPGPDANTALALDADWGLHPALKDTVYPLYQKGELAFVAFAGTDDTSRSHFETQDSIELGQPLDHARNYQSGFMSRLAATLAGAVTPIAFTGQLPLIFRGGAEIPNIALNVGGKPGIDARQSQLIEAMYRGTAFAPAVAEGFQVEDEVYKTIAVEMQAASRGATSPKGFKLEARRIARLMREKYTLGFVDVGGWDTHVNQGNANGYLANRIAELGQGIAGFADEMGEDWSNTIVVAISEFGRTFRENGNRGTDHGHGSVYWVAGGAIKGGRIAGDQVKVEQASLFQDRDYPVLNEYRAVLSGLLSRTYGLSDNRLDSVFPGSTPKNLGLV